MVKQKWNEGFLLVDLCLVIAMMSVFYGLLVPYMKMPDFTDKNYAEKYFCEQTEAMSERTSVLFEEIRFNEKGNVNKSGTMYEGEKVYVSMLGVGRLVPKE